MILSLLALFCSAADVPPPPAELLTVAEASDYSRTATYDDVIALIDRLDARSDILRRASMGTTVEGRDIPLIILADPPIESAQAAHASGKPIIFALGNIHAGEVCGKEALLMLTREIATRPDHELLRELIIVIAPIYNADGNERFAPVADNRPGQLGPKGVGIRPNAQGLDLNRDYVKLEAPETRALVSFLNEWDPHLTIDTHTTNGSRHRYTLTYDTPLHPTTHPAITNLLRQQLLPTVTERVKQRTNYDMFCYGNFNEAQTKWATYSSNPRFGGNYQGLRGQMSILSEAYSYAPFRDRVLCTLAFTREILRWAAEHAEDMIAVHEQVRRDTIDAGRNPQPDDTIALRDRFSAFHDPAYILGYKGDTDMPTTHQVVHLGRFEATRSIARPFAYIIERGCDNVIDNLRAHAVAFEPFAGVATVESMRITSVDRAERAFQGHQLVQVEADTFIKQRDFPPGSHIIYTAQPLGTLIVFMLEPESEDGLAAWNFFDVYLREGETFPVHRLRHDPSPIH